MLLVHLGETAIDKHKQLGRELSQSEVIPDGGGSAPTAE